MINITLIVVVASVTCIIFVRWRYRRLLSTAIDTLDTVHASLSPNIVREAELRRAIGVKLSDLCADTRIYPWKQKREQVKG